MGSLVQYLEGTWVEADQNRHIGYKDDATSDPCRHSLLLLSIKFLHDRKDTALATYPTIKFIMFR